MDKILIVDDEQPVLDGLKYLIAKHFENVTCETARSGREAIENVRFYHPDIILMDVKMPGISGIDAIRELKAQSPQTIFLLVSAYERFEIAKEAIGLGIQDYLLKPVSRESLIEVLGRARQIVQERRNQQRREIGHRDWKEEALVYLEHSLLFHSAVSRSGTADVEILLRLLGVDSKEGCIVWFEWRAGEERDIKDEFEQWRESVKFKLRCAIGAWSEGKFAVFLPILAEENPWERIPEPPQNIQWRASVGNSERVDRLARSYEEALWSLEVVPWGTIKTVGDFVQDSEEQDFPYDLEKAVLRAIDAGDPDQAASLVVPFWSALEAAATPDRSVHSLAGEFVTVLTHRKAMDGVLIPFSEISAVQKELAGATQGDPREALRTFLVRWTRRHRSTGEFSPVVERAMDFLRENFQKPISLEETAKAAGVHPQYLSRIFTQERGESFVDVLTRLRMNKAREFLRDGRNVKETAAALGYADPNYFSRLFKKCEGVPPGDFALGKREKS